MTFLREMWAWILSFSDPYFRNAVLRGFFEGFWDYFLALYPYVILGCLLGELLKFTSWTKLIYRFTMRFRWLSVLSATVLGILSPLCTYGTVPVLITLYGAGVPVAPLISFLAASSMMNPQLFLMTVGGLGWEIALWRLLLVFLFSLLCGFLSYPLPTRFTVRGDLPREPGTTPSTKEAVCMCEGENIPSPSLQENGAAILTRKKPPFSLPAYLRATGKSLLFVTRMMLIGIAVAALVDVLPMNLLFSEIDTTTVGGVLLAALAGIPVYACGGGTIPMIASLLGQGMSVGSALAFLTVGPATRITSLAAIASVFRKRFLLLYVLVLLLFSVTMGVFLRFL